MAPKRCAPPKRRFPSICPPPNLEEEEESEASEEEDEEAADDEMPQAKPAPKRPRASGEEEEEVSGEEEEEEEEVDHEMPQAKPAPNQEMDGLGKNGGASSSKAAANSGAGREMLYPFLAEEVKAIQKEHPGLFNREFWMIQDSKARELEDEIRKQRLSQMRLRTKVTNTLLDLAQ